MHLHRGGTALVGATEPNVLEQVRKVTAMNGSPLCRHAPYLRFQASQRLVFGGGDRNLTVESVFEDECVHGGTPLFEETEVGLVFV